jgi:hypothetical protein
MCIMEQSLLQYYYYYYYFILFFSSILIEMIIASSPFVNLAYEGKDIVFKFIIEYNSLRDFGP